LIGRLAGRSSVVMRRVRQRSDDREHAGTANAGANEERRSSDERNDQRAIPSLSRVEIRMNWRRYRRPHGNFPLECCCSSSARRVRPQGNAALAATFQVPALCLMQFKALQRHGSAARRSRPGRSENSAYCSGSVVKNSG
jgi:hypothetical protein